MTLFPWSSYPSATRTFWVMVEIFIVGSTSRAILVRRVMTEWRTLPYCRDRVSSGTPRQGKVACFSASNPMTRDGLTRCEEAFIRRRLVADMTVQVCDFGTGAVTHLLRIAYREGHQLHFPQGFIHLLTRLTELFSKQRSLADRLLSLLSASLKGPY